MHAICPIHLTLLQLTILIIRAEEYKLQSFSLRSFLQPPSISSLFGPNILMSTLFSNTPSLCSSLNVSDQFHTHTEPQPNYTFVYPTFVFRQQTRKQSSALNGNGIYFRQWTIFNISAQRMSSTFTNLWRITTYPIGDPKRKWRYNSAVRRHCVPQLYEIYNK
jgi:hypothetical protein